MKTRGAGPILNLEQKMRLSPACADEQDIQ